MAVGIGPATNQFQHYSVDVHCALFLMEKRKMILVKSKFHFYVYISRTHNTILKALNPYFPPFRLILFKNPKTTRPDNP